MTLNQHFERLYEDELDYVYTTLRRMGVSAKDVADVAHEVFVRVYRLLPQFDASRPAKPWLYTICYFASKEYRRNPDPASVAHASKEPAEGQEEALESAADEKLSPEAVAMLQSERELLYQALNALTDAQRMVMILFELEQRSMADVASMLRIPLHTAYSRLKAGRRALESVVKDILSEEEAI